MEKLVLVPIIKPKFGANKPWSYRKTLLKPSNKHNFCGNVFDTNQYGKLRVIRPATEGIRSGRRNDVFDVQFIDTGSITTARRDAIRKGAVKDPYIVNIYGAGCTGVYSDSDIRRKAYRIWESILQRCYSETCKFYPNYGGRGIFMETRWLCFENFIKDLPLLPGFDLWCEEVEPYFIDKDYFGGIYYGRDSCVFLNRQINTAIQKEAKDGIAYIGTPIKGKSILFQNQSSFSRESGLVQAHVNACIRNKGRMRHDGWTFEVRKPPKGYLYRPFVPYIPVNRTYATRI